MTGGQWAAVGAVAAGGVLVGVATVVLVSLRRAVRDLQRAVDDLRSEAFPLVIDARDAVQQANVELNRVDSLLGTAESVSSTVDSASRLAYLAFSNPVVKTLAIGSGTARAVRRFRRRG